MTSNTLEEIRYPIGRFTIDPEVTAAKRRTWIDQIGSLPELLRSAVAGLNDDQLERRYREGGWTVRQVAHHVADEHLHAFAYCKSAVTEEDPPVRVYEEPRWAETADARQAPVALSLNLLAALHARWVILLSSLDQHGFARSYHHPRRGKVTLDHAVQLYAWHGRHHAAQITGLRTREGW